MTPALQLPVELVEHEVTEQWRKLSQLQSWLGAVASNSGLVGRMNELIAALASSSTAARSASLRERAGAGRSDGVAGSGAGDADGPKTGRCR
jgi:hypothetical protein